MSVRVWNKSPHDFLIKAAKVTRTGVGLPAYYNDEVINSVAAFDEDLRLRTREITEFIGCVEPQKAR